MIKQAFHENDFILTKNEVDKIFHFLNNNYKLKSYTSENIKELYAMVFQENKLNGVNKVQGSKADYISHVDMSKVGGGYFSSEKNAKSFIEISILPLINNLPKDILIADFGGGEGYLIKMISMFLESNGFNVTSLVVDANKNYLTKASELGLNILESDISNICLHNQNIITMRSVNHYNSPDIQRSIIKSCHSSLNDNGYLISQILTGTQGDCNLMSKLMNHPLLGRSESSTDFYVSTMSEYIQMLKDFGFKNIKIEGYAPTTKWGPEETLWQRFNKHKRHILINQKKEKEVKDLDLRHESFIEHTNFLIKQELSENNTTSNFFLDADNNYWNTFQFPIISCQKR